MTWFKVDDKLHSHSKIRKVLADAPAALALWTVAGSWSADNLSDGFVPDHQLPWLMPSGAEDMARQLVTARLWRRVRGGYQFHEWASDADGTKRNPTRAEVEGQRKVKAEAGRKGGLAKAKAAATSANSPSTVLSNSQARSPASASGVLKPPTRPDPTLKTRGADLSDPLTPPAPEPPPPRCPKHITEPTDEPCRACGDARRKLADWSEAVRHREAQQREAAEAEDRQLRQLPPCVHGIWGGDRIRQATGTARCPQCRRFGNEPEPAHVDIPDEPFPF